MHLLHSVGTLIQDPPDSQVMEILLELTSESSLRMWNAGRKQLIFTSRHCRKSSPDQCHEQQLPQKAAKMCQMELLEAKCKVGQIVFDKY